MVEQLKILITFNTDYNTKFIIREIKKAGYDILAKRINSQEELRQLLINEKWDIILSEEIINNNFTALEILKIKNELSIKIPFILFCENIKNESLIELMNHGCSNFIFENNISNIGNVFKREIQNYKLEIQKNNELEQFRKYHDNLEVQVKRYQLAIDGGNDGIWEWDIINDTGYISFKWKEIINISNCELENFKKIWMGIIHPNDLKVVKKKIKEYFDKRSEYFICEYRVRTKGLGYIWILTRGKAIRDSSGNPIKMAGSHTNITEYKKAEEEIHHLAFYDKITGLPNRTLFEETLKKYIKNSKKKKEMFGLIYLDLDNFKTINDTLGHDFGDLLLKDVANLLKIHIDPQDIVVRLSGDEYAILIPKLISLEKLRKIADKIKRDFQNTFIIYNHEIYITVSIGIAIYPTDGEDGQTLLKNAESAMYCAKETGKNNYKFYVPEMNIKMMEKVKLQNDLRRALKNKEFVVYYQPKIDINTVKVVGFEALIRWIHPIEGLISPIKFIPEAEEMGLIVDIGEYVLRSACKQNKHWQDLGYPPKHIAVNLSARQFQQKTILDTIENILDETGLDSKWLELEITESISMNDLNFTISMLHNFNKIGVKVALDDFGTGYSSLNYLKKLPIQSLKIDKSFVDNITNNPKELAIAKAITTLAHTMNLSIIAEGVETEEQLLLLKDLKCDMAQGYYFSRPLPPEEVEKIL